MREQAEGRQEVDKHLEDRPAPANDQAPLLGTATRRILYEY
jgi:hypothetical protein